MLYPLAGGTLEEIREKMRSLEESLLNTTHRINELEDSLEKLQKIPHRMCALERSNKKLEKKLKKVFSIISIFFH